MVLDVPEGQGADADAACAQASAGGGPRHFLVAGNPRPALEAALASIERGSAGVLAIVLEKEGSTYAGVGDLVLFDGDRQCGWLSGGCLEPQLSERARAIGGDRIIEWMEVDTRDDSALLAGSALGCRGRLRIALMPLRPLQGLANVLSAWLLRRNTLDLHIGADGSAAIRAGGEVVNCRFEGPAPWAAADARWHVTLPPLPRALLLGAGPETTTLVPLLREVGWWTCVAEQRARWQAAGAAADYQLDTGASEALAACDADAALVMHHDFERDREALVALADSSIPFIGLLGPRRRRDDLFKLLTVAQQASLEPRLHAPIGLDLGGRGAQAIALSIAAQLQQWRATPTSA